MAMLKKIGRLFQIRTRLEAWLVIYAVALGAVERGRHYLEAYPGWGGWLLAVACTAVGCVAGGKCRGGDDTKQGEANESLHAREHKPPRRMLEPENLGREVRVARAGAAPEHR